MQGSTQRFWSDQDRHPGDRLRLFRTVAEHVGPDTPVLYPGSFVDVAASFAFDSVTYVDIDRRAAEFFADHDGVDEIIHRHRTSPKPPEWRFLAADYRTELDVAPGSVGLLVSLYAGFVSEHCTRYLAPGGRLLVNASHGDVAMATLEPRYALEAAVTTKSGCYSIAVKGLEQYLVAKRPAELTRQKLRDRGRGIAYVKSAFAYLFRLSSVARPAS